MKPLKASPKKKGVKLRLNHPDPDKYGKMPGHDSAFDTESEISQIKIPIMTPEKDRSMKDLLTSNQTKAAGSVNPL